MASSKKKPIADRSAIPDKDNDSLYLTVFCFGILTISLAICIYIQHKFVAGIHPHTFDMFLSWRLPLNEYLDRMDGPLARRIASNWLAYHAVARHEPMTVQTVSSAIGAWVALWFVAYAILAFFFPSRWFALLIGGATIYWAYLPDMLGGAATRIYPWDMPALVWMTLGVYVYWRRPLLLPVVILLGIPFKDTMATLLILPLVDWARDRKDIKCLICAGLSFLAILLAHFLISAALQFSPTEAISFRGWCSPEHKDEIRILYNLRYAFSSEINSAWIICSGLLLLGTLAGLMHIKACTGWLLLLGALTGGLLLGGVIHEYRIWLETLPVLLMILHTSGWLKRIKAG